MRDSLARYTVLSRAIKSSTTVVILNSRIDRIKQITRTLQQANYQEVHLISHGSPGCLNLGEVKLGLDTLQKYTSELKTWFSASNSSPTLLLYGCNVASGDAGSEFITKLQHLTGANIAASASLTGNIMQGGNWELEVTTSPDLEVDLAILVVHSIHKQEVLKLVEYIQEAKQLSPTALSVIIQVAELALRLVELQPCQGTDTILDFTDGSDLFGLTNGLSFADLNIIHNDDCSGVIIQDANNYHGAIAFVNNIDASQITEQDFVTL